MFRCFFVHIHISVYICYVCPRRREQTTWRLYCEGNTWKLDCVGGASQVPGWEGMGEEGEEGMVISVLLEVVWRNVSMQTSHFDLFWHGTCFMDTGRRTL